jgi:hypothetical protein
MAQPSFVEVAVTLRVQVLDQAALLAAVEQLDGPPAEAFEHAVRALPANCVGRLINPTRLLLVDLPGVAPAGCSVSANDSLDGR